MSIEIPIVKPKSEFEAHLNIKDNKRIIFSAKFGTGKTTFLKKYYSNKSEIHAIHLFPINYSVAKNEDIFELLKYDILFKLLKIDHQYQDINIENKETITKLLKEEALNIFIPFLKAIPNIGESIFAIAEKLNQINDKLKDSKTKSKVSESTKTFIEKIVNTAGNIYESDFYTKLIKYIIGQLQSNPERADSESKREVVLIIDDMDRIDPEHIFRILNIFASHYDHEADNNKFGFDKIILVCDIENIRQIFSNKYGLSVDFSGYIDKFYSTEVFYYNNDIEISNYVDQILELVEIRHNNIPELNFSGDQSMKMIFKLIIDSLVSCNLLSLRNLLKLTKTPYNVKKYRLDKFLDNSEPIFNINTYAFILYDFLIYLFGNIDNTLNQLGKLKSYSRISKDYNFSYELMNICFFVIGFEEAWFGQSFISSSTDYEIKYLYNGSYVKVKISLSIIDSFNTKKKYYSKVMSFNEQIPNYSNILNYDIFTFLHDMVSKIKNEKLSPNLTY